MKQKFLVLWVLLTSISLYSQESSEISRQSDVIYLKKDGFALTFDVVKPQKQNGSAVAFMMSGGWFSNHDSLKPSGNVIPAQFHEISSKLLAVGYTVFYVVHDSQPRFTIPEIVEQTSTAVNYIRSKSSEFGIDGNKIGVLGGSAGGHLSLMQGLQGKHQVQAVVAFFPPTDFLNYGIPGQNFDIQVRKVLKGRNPFISALELRTVDPKDLKISFVTDKEKVEAHIKRISPVNLVDKDDAPIFLLHGDVDELVPLQQSELLLKKLQEIGVPSKLYVKKGGNHGWQITGEELKMILDWFNTHLK